jgi:hypothetical protein
VGAIVVNAILLTLAVAVLATTARRRYLARRDPGLGADYVSPSPSLTAIFMTVLAIVIVTGVVVNAAGGLAGLISLVVLTIATRLYLAGGYRPLHK